jgi:hypothetical protein
MTRIETEWDEMTSERPYSNGAPNNTSGYFLVRGTPWSPPVREEGDQVTRALLR